MANRIIIKNKSTTGAPANGDLVEGELAINTADQKLYSKDATTIFELTDHDALTNYIANEHIDWTSTTENLVTTGTIFGSTFRTSATGIFIADGGVSNDPLLSFYEDDTFTARNGFIQFADSGLFLRSEVHGVPVSIDAENSIGVVSKILTADPDLTTDLNCATSIRFQIGSVTEGGVGPNYSYSANPYLIKETAAATADIATYGQLWIKNTTPNELWFTNDTGVDVQVTTSTGVIAAAPLTNDFALTTGDTFTGDVNFQAGTDGTMNLYITEAGTGFVGAQLQYDGAANELNIMTGNNPPVTRMTIPRDSGAITMPGSLAVTGAVTGSNLAVSNWNTAFGWGDHSVENYAVTTGDTFTGPVIIEAAQSADLLELGDTTAGENIRVRNSGGIIKLIPHDGTDYNFNNEVYYDHTVDRWVIEGDVDLSGDTYDSTKYANWNTAFGWGDHGVENYLKNIVEDVTPQLGGDLDMNGKYVTSTYHGRVGNSSLEAQFTLESEWADLPVGYGRMARNTTGTAGGAPVNNYGYFTKTANRDSSGGWGGIWVGYTNGENYMGRAGTNASFASWDKLWSDVNLSTKAQFNTACTDGTFLFSGDVTSDTGVPAMLSSGGLPVLNTGITAAEYRSAIGAGTSSTTGTVTSVGGTGTVSGLTLTGTVTSSGNLTLGGAITGFATTSHVHTFDSLTSKTSGTGNYQTSGDMIADNFEATGLGPTTTPGASDLYMGGYGIIGDRSAQLIYVTNANSNASSRVGLATGGSHSSANVRLQVWLETATGRTSAGQIKDHGGTLRDIGFNVLPTFNFNASDTLQARHCGHATGKTNTSLYTLTGPASSDVDFPVGGVAHVYNLGTSGNYLISDTGTCTMYVCDGTAAPQDIVGTCTLAPGGMVSLWRYSTTAIYITGTGVTV